MCQGLSKTETEPAELTYRYPPAMRVILHEVSCRGSATSISEGSAGLTCGPVVMRRRTVRGDTNSIANGSAGFPAYSPSGNVTPSNGLNTVSMLLKAMRGTSWFRAQAIVPDAVTGSNVASLSARKDVLRYSRKSGLTSTRSLTRPGG